MNPTAETFVIPACAVNAPHRRDRVWIVAYANSIGQQDEQERHKQTNTNKKWNVATEKQVRNTKQCGLGEVAVTKRLIEKQNLIIKNEC